MLSWNHKPNIACCSNTQRYLQSLIQILNDVSKADIRRHNWMLLHAMLPYVTTDNVACDLIIHHSWTLLHEISSYVIPECCCMWSHHTSYLNVAACDPIVEQYRPWAPLPVRPWMDYWSRAQLRHPHGTREKHEHRQSNIENKYTKETFEYNSDILQIDTLRSEDTVIVFKANSAGQ